MPSNKIQKLITIAKIGEKERKFWIKDTEGEIYSGFTEWQGTENIEYSQLKNGNHGDPFKEGEQALIEFTKSAGTDKNGNDVIYKNLKAIYPPDSKPLQHRLEIPPKAPSASVNDDYGKRLALHGFVNALLSSGKNLVEVEGMLPALIDLEDEIEKALNQPKGWARAQAIFNKEADEIDVSDIPFPEEPPF
jgi:hypothetical protein